jgi:ubiquitin-protein ligase
LFEFHAYFPIDYPNSVPEVVIHTTDNGKVRFNPNLYETGKVCLSLLGTWQSSKSASWIPEVSTFYQVIISIQSLIFVDEPYFNEPGYESLINTEKGNNTSKLDDNIDYAARFDHIQSIESVIDIIKNELIQIEDNTFWSYEEAETSCIDKLIEIVKDYGKY